MKRKDSQLLQNIDLLLDYDVSTMFSEKASACVSNQRSKVYVRRNEAHIPPINIRIFVSVGESNHQTVLKYDSFPRRKCSSDDCKVSFAFCTRTVNVQQLKTITCSWIRVDCSQST